MFSEAAARSAGVEPQQHQLLLAIKGLALDARPTIGAIAERLQIQHHSAVELTKRAVRAGLIERRTSEADRREALLVITPKGETILRRLSVAHRDELRVEGSELLSALRALVAPTRADGATTKTALRRKPSKKETR